MFARRRDLFADLTLAFGDRTRLFFNGGGAEELGRYGRFKDPRPDRRQLLMGAVLP